MNYQGIDTAARITPSVAQKLRESGVSFAARYLVPEEGTTAWKALSASEAADIRGAGLALMLCWETSAKRMLGGASAGAEDGAKARELSEAMGVPQGAVIYYAADFDVQEEDLPALEAYFRAARIASGKYNAGIYGGQRAIAGMVHACDWLWQCVAWSGAWLPYATVQQYAGQDFDEAEKLGAKVGIPVDLDAANSLAGMWMPEKTQDEDGEIPMKKTTWKKFLAAAGVRALRTFAQTTIATIGTSAVLSEVNWALVGSASVLAAILSLLTSVATGLPEVDEDE